MQASANLYHMNILLVKGGITSLALGCDCRPLINEIPYLTSLYLHVLCCLENHFPS